MKIPFVTKWSHRSNEPVGPSNLTAAATQQPPPPPPAGSTPAPAPAAAASSSPPAAATEAGGDDFISQEEYQMQLAMALSASASASKSRWEIVIFLVSFLRHLQSTNAAFHSGMMLASYSRENFTILNPLPLMASRIDLLDPMEL